MASPSILGGHSGVTVHGCMAADSLPSMEPSSASVDVTPLRTDDSLGTRNFASAVSGDLQNQLLPGSTLPRAGDTRAEWLVQACNRAAGGVGSGSTAGGATPGGAPTPQSRQMLSACATPPAEPGSLHPGMEDVRDKPSEDKKVMPHILKLDGHRRCTL